VAAEPRIEKRQTTKERIRAEIVEITRGMHRHGLVDDAELEQTTLRMLGRDALPKVAELSAADIAKLRQKAGLSQSVLAGYMNVAVNTVSQWERGQRRPTGAALKLLHVVKRSGIEVLR
jgi:putative transcriptional regulator